VLQRNCREVHHSLVSALTTTIIRRSGVARRQVFNAIAQISSDIEDVQAVRGFGDGPAVEVNTRLCG
jgi:hypothetical protein